MWNVIAVIITNSSDNLIENSISQELYWECIFLYTDHKPDNRFQLYFTSFG